MATSEDESWMDGFVGEERDEHEALAEPGYAGVVGENATFEVTLERVVDFETQWGRTYIYKFKDELGRLIVWKTKTAPKRVLGAIDEEEAFLVHGTVKELGSYRGMPETRVIRCWLQPLDGDEAEAEDTQEVA